MPKCLVKDAITVNQKKYKYLEAPGTFEILAIAGSKLTKVPDKNIERIHSTWVECDFVRNNFLPLDPNDAKAANPRAPDCEHSVVAEMKDTLKHKPEKFTTLNGGITIVCDDVTVDEKTSTLTIKLQDGDGIVNGGHTYYSIASSGKIDSSALVKIEIIQISKKLSGALRREEIKNIAVSRNKNRAVSDESKANFLGYFEPWKKTLAQYSSHVSWKDGDVCICSVTKDNIEKPLKAKELVKLMSWFEYKSYNFHMVYNHKVGPKTPSKSQWQNWSRDVSHSNDPIGWMMPLTLPILQLREWYAESFEKIKKTVPMTSLAPIRGVGGGPRTTLKKGGRPFATDFGEYLMKGIKDTPSFFDDSKTTKSLSALAEHIFGNFRSLLWRKNLKGGVVLTGWQYHPSRIWSEVKEQIIGALYWEWANHGYNNLDLQRKCTDMFVIDFCEWISVKSGGKTTSLREKTTPTTPPEIIYFNHQEWVPTPTGETPQMWLNFGKKKDNAGFDSTKSGATSAPYSRVV
jgi:hypothetical protein